MSAISNDVSEKQSIVYTSSCIESARIEQYHSDKQLNDNCSSNTWNEEYDSFDHQLEKWGVGKLSSDHSESVKRDLRAYIEYWERLLVEKMIKELILAYWQNMEDYLFMILIWRRYIPLMIKALGL